MGRKSASDELLASVLKDLKKDLGDRADVQVMGDEGFAAQPREWFSTGLTLLDRAIKGGIPYGRIVEVFGGEVTGKSMCVGTWLGIAQRAGAVTALIDTEQAYSVEFVRDLCHADPNKVYYLDPITLEDCWDAVDMFIERVRQHDSKRPIMIAIDSLAGLPPKEEEEATFDENSSVACAARINKRAMRKLRRKVAHQNVAVIMTNQVIAKIGGLGWGEKTTTSGGGGPKYFSSVRLSMDHIGKIVEDKTLVGQRIRATVYKNRFDAPGRQVDFRIDFKRGIDDIDSIVEYLRAKGHLGSKKGFCIYGQDTTQHRPKAFKDMVRASADLYEQLKALALQTFDRTLAEDFTESGPEEEVGEED